MSVLIFLPPDATTLKEAEDLEREGSPLTEDFSRLKPAGLRLTDAITEDAICFTTETTSWCVAQNEFLYHNNNDNSDHGLVIIFYPRGVEFVVECRIWYC